MQKTTDISKDEFIQQRLGSTVLAAALALEANDPQIAAFRFMLDNALPVVSLVNPYTVGGVVKFNMRQKGKALALINRGDCTIVGVATNGSVLYTGTVADTAVAGTMEGEFVTLDGSSVPQYFPDAKDTYLLGYITPAIA